MVKERKTTQCLPVNEISSEDLRLTAVEENTLRYVSGYIPYSLRQNYLKLKDGDTSRAILSVIEFWCVDHDSSSKTFLQYTEEWTYIYKACGNVCTKYIEHKLDEKISW